MKTWQAALGWAIVGLVCLPAMGQAKGEDEAALRKQALALNEITGRLPLKGQVRTLIDNPQQTRKLLAVASRMAEDKRQPFNYNATLILASAAAQLEQADTAEKFYRLHAKQAIDLVSVQGVVAAYEGLMNVFFKAKKYKECERACWEFVRLPTDDDDIKRLKLLAIRRMVYAMALEGQFDSAIELCDDLLKKGPDNLVFLDVKARVLRLAGRNKDAVKLYKEIREIIEKNKELSDKDREELIEDLRYDLSGVYVETNEIDKAAEELKALLKKYPDNPAYNNDLGYIWADRGMNLEESERLIRRAIAEDKKTNSRENPAYLDSLGWVLFKQKKYKEARDVLLKAVEDKDGQHIEILDHLADVYMALGQKDKAVETWKKGLKVVGSSKREQQRKEAVQKKLKNNE